MDVPAAHRAQTKKRIESYKAQLQEAEQKLRRASVATGAKAARDELFAYDGTSEDQREMLLSNTERLSRTSRRLDEGHRVAIETQDVAMTIMSDLHDQRETIERSRGRVGIPLLLSFRFCFAGTLSGFLAPLLCSSQFCSKVLHPCIQKGTIFFGICLHACSYFLCRIGNVSFCLGLPLFPPHQPTHLPLGRRVQLKQTDGVLARSQRVLGSMYNR